MVMIELSPLNRCLLFFLGLFTSVLLPYPHLIGQPGPTRPERTAWEQTSSSSEVLTILGEAADAHPRMHLQSMGYSTQGQVLPLLVVGPGQPLTPKEARHSGLLRVYLQGNIHAGEVAGKEALLRLVRRLTEGAHENWTHGWILLINPNFNPDGNERVHLLNRTLQHGPVGGMGTRENAQGLDLNRDQMKLDSPEARSLAQLFNQWDPHVFVDLHTTNGTRHAYHLTYSPPLHPATPDPIDSFLREQLFPAVDDSIYQEYGWHFWHYGNRMNRKGIDGWWTFDPRPRYVTNYAGIRNRVGILSEAYSYATFEDRILASERFVEAILEFLLPRREALYQMVDRIDRENLVGRKIPLQGRHLDAPPVHSVLLGDVDEERHPFTGGVLLRRKDVVTPTPLPAGISFQPHLQVEVPRAFWVDPRAEEVIERLQAHGIQLASLPRDTREIVQNFQVVSWEKHSRPFQDRLQTRVEGVWSAPAPSKLQNGYRVDMRQPLARLALLLLEPRADDGLLNWGFYDAFYEEYQSLPVLRIPPAYSSAE